MPDLSIEVDDLSVIHRRMQAAGSEIEYGPVTDYVHDPLGRLVNVLEHR